MGLVSVGRLTTIKLLTSSVVSIGEIAEQMDHTSTNMIRQHYGMWINEDGTDVICMLQRGLGLQLLRGAESRELGKQLVFPWMFPYRHFLPP